MHTWLCPPTQWCRNLVAPAGLSAPPPLESTHFHPASVDGPRHSIIPPWKRARRRLNKRSLLLPSPGVAAGVNRTTECVRVVVPASVRSCHSTRRFACAVRHDDGRCIRGPSAHLGDLANPARERDRRTAPVPRTAARWLILGDGIKAAAAYLWCFVFPAEQIGCCVLAVEEGPGGPREFLPSSAAHLSFLRFSRSDFGAAAFVMRASADESKLSEISVVVGSHRPR